MQAKCKDCGAVLGAKVALDPSQFFTYSLSLIDLIDEKLERFISETDYGKYVTIVILSDESYDKSVLATENRVGAYDISFKDLKEIKDTEICFKTAEKFKGLEADVIIYLKNDYPGIPRNEIEKCREYVALTRARYYLYVLETKRT